MNDRVVAVSDICHRKLVAIQNHLKLVVTKEPSAITPGAVIQNDAPLIAVDLARPIPKVTALILAHQEYSFLKLDVAIPVVCANNVDVGCTTQDHNRCNLRGHQHPKAEFGQLFLQ